MKKMMRDVNFHGQFRLVQRTKYNFLDWENEHINEWTLQHCPSLQITHLFDSDNLKIGSILGCAITQDGSLQLNPLQLPFSIGGNSFEGKLEKFVSSLAGRYAVIIINDKISRIYIDPAGQLSIVYNLVNKTVGSSLYVVSDFEKPTGEFVSLLNIPASDSYYPFGITPNQNVKRILPNHFLNLQEFEEVRHWPKERELFTRSNSDITSTVAKISQKLESNISAVLEQYPVYMSLTAGRDSRMLLAASRRHLKNIHFFTMRIPDQNARRDCRVATKLARCYNLKHEILEWREATSDQLDKWQLRGGYSGAGRTWKATRTLLQLDPQRVFMPGLCGEVGRAYFWKDGDLTSNVISAKEIVARLKFPDHPQLTEAISRWKSELPFDNPLDILDFLYIEQRLGCWAGPNHYGHINNKRILPLSDRQIFSLMLQLPADYRFSQNLATDVIKQLWPELLNIPFNKDTRIREAARWTKNKSRALVQSKPALENTISTFRTFFR